MSVTDTQDQGPSEVSRRTLIRAAAGAGVAVAAVGGAGVAAAAVADHAGPEADGYSRAGAAGTDQPQVTGALVAYVTDLPAGTVEIFSDDARTQITDRELATRIARATQK
jgi:hypothetical protein